MEISNLSEAEFKTLIMRKLKELSEDLSSIKKIQSEMKNTLIKIQTIYRETTVEWMKLRIKSIIWNIGTKNQPLRTTRRKKNTPKRG